MRSNTFMDQSKFSSTVDWHSMDSLLQWWRTVGTVTGVPCKAVRSLALLVTWELWREQNARIFKYRHQRSPTMLIAKIKEEARLWCSAGAKRLRQVLPMA